MMERTRVEKCELLKEILKGNEYEVELTQFLDKLIEGFRKKRVRKLSDTDAEIMNLIAEVLATEEAMTVADLRKNATIAAYRYEINGEEKDLTSSKISALLKKMENVEVIDNGKGKEKAYKLIDKEAE